MKRIFSIFIAAVYLLLFAVNACCIDIDGADGAEWRGAEVMTIFKGESNSNVTFASVKWIKDESVNIVYFSFQFHEENITVSESSSGMSLKVNNSQPVRVICNETVAEYHSDLYSISGAGTRNENNGSICEFKVGFKRGIPEVINAEVTFIDSEGNSSNLYEFSVEGVVETEAETTNTLTSVNGVIESMISDITAAEKTTKKTVKTTKTAEKTTKKKKETTTKKASTTKRKSKTTKSAENTTAVTEYVTEAAVIITETNTQTSSASFLQTSISSSEGKKYKYITMGAGVAALILVSVLGVSAANKKAKENDPKS